LNCVIKTEGLLKVTASHVGLQCENDNISEIVQDRYIVTTDDYTRLIGSDMACEIVAVPMTLSNQGHSPTANVFKLYFSYLDAAADSERCVVPLQWLSLLLN